MLKLGLSLEGKKVRWETTILIAAFVALGAGSSMADEAIAPEEFLALIDASAARIKSISVVEEVSRYKVDNHAASAPASGLGAPYHREMVEWRATAEKEYMKLFSVGAGADDEVIRQTLRTPKWEKRLTLDPRDRPQGKVSLREKTSLAGPAALTHFLYDGLDFRNQVILDKAEVRIDRERGLCAFISPSNVQGQVYVWVYDFAKAMPVRTAMLMPVAGKVWDGRLDKPVLVGEGISGEGIPEMPGMSVINRLEFKDWRQIEDGIWFPFLQEQHRVGEVTKVVFRQAVLNSDLPDELLDLKFPAGTVVQDEIAQLAYEIDETKSDEGAASAEPLTTTEDKTPNALLKFENLGEPQPPTNEQLKQSAEQARVMTKGDGKWWLLPTGILGAILAAYLAYILYKRKIKSNV